MKKKLLLISIASLFAVLEVKAQATFTSSGAGPNSWSNSASWGFTGTDADGIPDADDNVTISTGHTINITANQSCNTLTVNGTVSWTVAAVKLTVNGVLTTNTCTFGSTVAHPNTDSLIVKNNWVVTASRTTTIGSTNGINISMPANTLTINSNSNFTFAVVSGNGGTSPHVFNNIIIQSGTSTGGKWNCNVSQDFIINGNITNNSGSNSTRSGLFTSGAGKYTLTGTGNFFAGGSLIEFTGEVICNGTYTNNTSARGVIFKRLSGTGSFSQGVGGVLGIKAFGDENYVDFTISTFNASALNNTVAYELSSNIGTQVVQTPTDNAYHHLKFNGCDALLPPTTNINGDILIAAPSLTSDDDNFVINIKGNWVNLFTFGAFISKTGTVNFTGNSLQTIDNSSGEAFYNVTCSGTGLKLLGKDLDILNNLTIDAGATLDLNVNAPYTLSVEGNFTNNGTLLAQANDFYLSGNFTNNGTFSSQTGKVILIGSAAQTINGTTNTQFYNLDIDNTSGVSLGSHQSIKRTLNLVNGTFTTTPYDFTLLSTTTLTGRIGEMAATADIVGNIIIQRYLPATLKTDWRYICAPVTATVAEWKGDFITTGFEGADYDPNNTSNFCSIQTYKESVAGHLDLGFTNIVKDTATILPGKGFAAYIGNSMENQPFSAPITFSVSGAPGKNDVTVALTNSGGDLSNDGWNLVGNPYPSDIIWDSTGIDKAATGVSAMYMYNPALSAYITYSGGVSSPDAGPMARYIPSSAAFWVKATTSGNLVFHESAKADTNRNYYSPPQVQKAQPELLRLTVAGNGKQNETAIRAEDNATLGFDNAYDAYKMPSTGTVTISSCINNNTDMTINAVPLTGSLSIPVRVTVPVTGTYVIAKGAGSTWSLSGCTILEDMLTGVKTDLRTSSYSFTIADTTKAPRFVLHLSEGIAKSSVAISCAGKSDGKATAKGNGNGPFTYVWKNSNGTVIRTTANITTADNIDNLPEDIYTVDIAGGSPLCGDVTDTIVVKAPQALTPAFEIAAVNCNGGNSGSIVTRVKGGTQPYTYNWSTNANTATLKDLAKGEYTLTVTDANNCSAVAAATVNAVAAVSAAFTPVKTTVYLVEDEGKAAFTNETQGDAFYRWNFGDKTEIDTLPSPEHYYTKVGVYKVQLIASTADCADTTYREVTVKFNTTSSVTEMAKNKLVSIGVANAEQAFVKFDYAENSNAVITVQNVLGQSLTHPIKVTPNNQTVYIDMHNLSSNLLLITVTTDYGRVTKKIVH